ncbi:UbiA-like protein EboC [Pedobacter polysacchareus]|uniref:UbiA-like protein EboC n=1 Tax=Pedobacter polysacchareus TaxID=2861973 RepID=UPI001C992F10|nr:UbiA-like protein EboC [Pedobacter polysacchareus]
MECREAKEGRKGYYYLTLMRPSNLMTALSDILGGIAISGFFGLADWSSESLSSIALLLLSTIGLYGGGIVFNDVFDLKADQVSRPERVLPSGKVGFREAVQLGAFLLLIGIAAAAMVSMLSGLIALGIAILALLYNKVAKHHAFFGPLNMGLCRGGNLLLGMSILPDHLFQNGYIILVPVIFVAAITLTAQKEVSGNNKSAILLAMFLDIMVVAMFFAISQFSGLNLWIAAPFLLLWYGLNFLAKFKAYQQNRPDWIKRAVKTGVLSLILLNACYIAGFANWFYALPVLFLLPISVLLAKRFAVT